MKKWWSIGGLVLVTIIWGGGFIATAAALETFNPFYVLMIRFVGSALLSVAVAARAIREIKASTIRKGLIAGIFLFLAFAFQTFGLQGSTASTNAFLTSTNVIFVPYIIWLIFRRRPSLRHAPWDHGPTTRCSGVAGLCAARAR